MTVGTLHRARAPGLLCITLLAGCTHTVKVEPIKIEPIDITLHIYLEADQKLDEFFGDVEGSARTPAVGEATPVSGAQSEGAKP